MLLAITLPVAEDVKHPTRAVLIVPQLQRYKPKLIRPPRIQPPTQRLAKALIPPPVLKMLEVKPRPVESAPIIQQMDSVASVQPLPKIELPEPPPAPKPQVHTGIFEAVDPSRATERTKQIQTGAFGEISEIRAGSGNGNNHNASVRTAGFGDATVLVTSGLQRVAPAVLATTPTEVLFKPKPAYTAEARDLKIEGQVSLEVVFQASGTVRVIRVLHGLGHGLDEAAQQAAQQVRFRPATRAGTPIDTTATIHITFELT